MQPLRSVGQAWGGPRALKTQWREAGAIAANGHWEARAIEIGGMAAGTAGNTSMLASAILLQTAQRSWAIPVGVCGAGAD